jgi:hypothetical protein
MKIRIKNEFHNVNISVALRGEITWEKIVAAKRRHACKLQGCQCETKIYDESSNQINEESFWKLNRGTGNGLRPYTPRKGTKGT